MIRGQTLLLYSNSYSDIGTKIGKFIAIVSIDSKGPSVNITHSFTAKDDRGTFNIFYAIITVIVLCLIIAVIRLFQVNRENSRLLDLISSTRFYD
jgi:hypothetical protein